MHLLSGIIKRNCESFLNIKNRPCSIENRIISAVEKRIGKFMKVTFNDIFKCKIGEFKDINNSTKWKCNQTDQFFFFIFPIIFEDLLDVNVFSHNLMLIYVIYNLWSKVKMNWTLN